MILFIAIDRQATCMERVHLAVTFIDINKIIILPDYATDIYS